MEDLVLSRGQTTSKDPVKKGERKSDTASGKSGTIPNKKSKEYESSKDEKKTSRNKQSRKPDTDSD